MQFKKWLKDRRVWYGAAAVGGIIVLYMIFRPTKTRDTAADGDSDTGYLYFPIDPGISIGGGNGSATNDPTASLVDLTAKQITSQTQLGLGAIGSDFMTQILEKLKTNTLVRTGTGVEGTFGFDEGGMLDFDFSFKAPMPTPAQPKQNVKSTPVTTTSYLGLNQNKGRS